MAILNDNKLLKVKLRTKEGPGQTINAVENPVLAGGWLFIKGQAGYMRISESQIISYSVEWDDIDIASYIANSIDNYNRKSCDVAMEKLEGRTIVTMLDDRYTVIGEKLTPDECRELIENIKSKRCGFTVISNE